VKFESDRLNGQQTFLPLFLIAGSKRIFDAGSIVTDFSSVLILSTGPVDHVAAKHVFPSMKHGVSTSQSVTGMTKPL